MSLTSKAYKQLYEDDFKSYTIWDPVGPILSPGSSVQVAMRKSRPRCPNAQRHNQWGVLNAVACSQEWRGGAATAAGDSTDTESAGSELWLTGGTVQLSTRPSSHSHCRLNDDHMSPCFCVCARACFRTRADLSLWFLFISFKYILHIFANEFFFFWFILLLYCTLLKWQVSLTTTQDTTSFPV